MKKQYILYIFLCLLYGSVGYLAPGYDDEFFNINLIEKLGLGIVAYTQSTDVHPPGSYLINYFLYDTLGTWERVRLASSLFTAATLIYAINAVRREHGERAGLIAFFLLGLNPAILLWCTGIRWYAYFVPILIWLSMPPPYQNWRHWARCFCGLFILAYIGYAVLIVAAPILFIYWRGSPQSAKEKLASIAKYGAITLALYAHQAYIFMTVHVKYKGDQISSLVKSLTGIVTAQLGNQGLFPVSAAGLITMIGTSGLMLIIVHQNASAAMGNRHFIAYAAGLVGSMVTGLAGKFRNLVVISPWQAIWITTATTKHRDGKLLPVFMSLLIIGNVWGIYNVATHQNTTKNSWNLPIELTMSHLRQEAEACRGNTLVITHDVGLAWQANHAGYKVLSPFAAQPLPPEKLASKYECVFLLKTYAGSIDNLQYNKMIQDLRLIHYDSSATIKLGKDSYYSIKKRMDPRYPEHMIELTQYTNVSNLAALTSWQPK